MSLNQSTNVQPQYEDYEPPFDWDQDEGSATFLLPGFKKEQLRVQITSTRMLKLSGERKISENNNKIKRFHKELPIPPDTDTNGISAKFESGILYIRLPKLITPINPTTTQLEPPKPKPNEALAPTLAQTPTDSNESSQKKHVNKDKETPTLTPTEILDGLKESYQKKQHVNKEKEQNAIRESGDHSKELVSEKGEELAKAMEKRTPTMETASRQAQEYKNAVYGMVEQIKRQKKLANLVLVFFFVLVFVIYVKKAIKSSFGGGPKTHEL